MNLSFIRWYSKAVYVTESERVSKVTAELNSGLKQPTSDQPRGLCQNHPGFCEVTPDSAP